MADTSSTFNVVMPNIETVVGSNPSVSATVTETTNRIMQRYFPGGPAYVPVGGGMLALLSGPALAPPRDEFRRILEASKPAYRRRG